MLFLHYFGRLLFFLMGEKEVILRGAQPQKLEFSSAALESQMSWKHNLSSCLRNMKRCLGHGLAPTSGPVCSHFFQLGIPGGAEMWPGEEMSSFKILTIGYRISPVPLLLPLWKIKMQYFAWDKFHIAKSKLLLLTVSASAFSFVSQGVTGHTGIKEDVLHWFLEWFFINLVVCRWNPVTYAFVMTLLSVI